MYAALIIYNTPLTSDQDEISLKSIPASEGVQGHCNKRARTSAPGSQTTQQESSPTQTHLTDFFASPSKVKSRKSASPPCNVIHELSLTDTKTRRSNSLPSDDDAFPSRMQLMLYHHLLSALLSPTFSFSAFWKKVEVDPFAQFSDAFLMQSGLRRQAGENVVLASAECLDDLTDLWHSTVHSLQVQGVSPALEIVYRTQPKRQLKLSAVAPEASRPTSLNDGFGIVADREARDLALAIEASRKGFEDDPDLQRALAESLRDVMPKNDSEAELTNVSDTQFSSCEVTEQLSDKPNIPWYARSTTADSSQSESVERDLQMGKRKEPQPETPGVIGRKIFAFDEAALHAYVQDVLQWWRGERPPRGVDLEHVRRCSYVSPYNATTLRRSVLTICTQLMRI